MSGVRSGLILLLVAIPFGLYAAWQVRTVARGDFLVSSAPGNTGLPTPEELAAARVKAEQFARDVRTTSAVALQFRKPDAEDRIADPDCTAVVSAATKRSASLVDLDTFLSGRANPIFTGQMKERYEDWYNQTESLRLAAIEIEKWFAPPEPTIGSRTAAEAEMKRFEAKLEAYTKGNSIFMDRAQVAAWRVRAVARIITALANTVKAPYERVLALPLPLPSATHSADVKTAVEALRELKARVALLEELVDQAKAAGITLSKEAETARAGALQSARDWSAAEELLALFAEPELFTNPKSAATWVPKVEAQFTRTQTDAGKELIRKKVQEFCEAYIPRAARLDAEVLIRGKLEPRKSVTIEYDSDAKSQPLTDLPDKLNEFNFQMLHKGFDRIVWSGGGRFTGMAEALRPTPRSIAARDYSQARAPVTVWTPSTLNELKMKCEVGVAALQLEERRKHLDELVGVGGGPEWTRTNTRIWTRLTVLGTAMEKHPVLFETKR